MTANRDSVSSDASPTRLAVGSWALYDLANTMFSMNIVSLFASLWVVNVMGGTDATWGFTMSISYAVIFVVSPFLGALTDQAPKRMPFLVASTIVCVAFTALMGRGGLALSLVFFAIANIAYQAGLQFYDALLPDVSREDNRGRIGGLGVGLGYVGSFVGVAVATLILGSGIDDLSVDQQHARYTTVFQVTAALFLLFALPCFLFVRERRRQRTFSVASVAAAARQVASTVRASGRYPGLLRFLIGRVFYTDSVNTVIVFMGLYVTAEVGFDQAAVGPIMMVAIAFAVIGGFGWGAVVDRVGPKRTLDWVLFLWMAIFVWTAVVGMFDLPRLAFLPVPPLAGIALGGTWAADRPYMLRLTPPARIGEFYGLYGMVGRFSAITGPFVWGFIVDILGWGRPAAIATLLAGVVIAYVILRKVSDEPRAWPPEERLDAQREPA
ncbi:MAG TPA: MFS transporter [Longimicrobiales bacterium]|nr:MFS transporter [Longimicrobiales bacterium]